MEERRNLICERLDRLPHIFHYDAKPMGGYYILPEIKFPHKNSIEAAFTLQKETNVITIRDIRFGPMGENHIRFSFGGGTTRGPKGKELITAAFDRLQEWGKRFV